MSVFIEDGYTMDGYVAEVPRMHEAVSFTFRPMRVVERSRFVAEQQKYKTPEEQEAYGASVIAKYIQSWDVQHGKQRLDLTPKNLLNIHPAAYYSILNQVMGVRAPDLKPDVSNMDQLENMTDLLEEADAKN